MVKRETPEMVEDEPEILSDTIPWIVLGIGVLVLVICLMVNTLQSATEASNIDALNERVSELTGEAEERKGDEDVVKNEVIYKTTGINPKIVTADSDRAEKFFKPAFSWENGAEYDSARANYSELLGDKSPFVDTYLADNLKVEEFNYIDVNSIQARYKRIELFALAEDGDKMDYLGVVTYNMIQSEEDLVAGDAMVDSQAIMRFTMDGQANARTVTAVTAYPGFTDTVKPDNN